VGERPGGGGRGAEDDPQLPRAVLADGVRDEEDKLRADNPRRKTRPEPDGFDDKDGSETITFLDEAEFDLIFEGMAFDPDAQDLILVDIGTGLRWGEISAVDVA
jgi:hypothetical protein